MKLLDRIVLGGWISMCAYFCAYQLCGVLCGQVAVQHSGGCQNAWAGSSVEGLCVVMSACTRTNPVQHSSTLQQPDIFRVKAASASSVCMQCAIPVEMLAVECTALNS